MHAKDKSKLKEYEDTRFLELREELVKDKGLPDLEQETKTIIETA
jgi:hypothetical protein